MLNQLEIVEKYQCPGCASGINTKSGCFKQDPDNFSCGKHCAGTVIGGAGTVNLGLPKGFNRLGPIDTRIQKSNIRIFEKMPEYNAFNIPLWAMEHEGNLLVCTALPRLHQFWIDIIPGKSIKDLPTNVIDISTLDLSSCV